MGAVAGAGVFNATGAAGAATEAIGLAGADIAAAAGVAANAIGFAIAEVAIAAGAAVALLAGGSAAVPVPACRTYHPRPPETVVNSSDIPITVSAAPSTK